MEQGELEPSAPLPPVAGAAPPDYLYPAFWAGFCAGILSGVPILDQGLCLWISGSGTLAVYFFRLKNGYPLTNASEGARLGFFTGFWGFLVSALVSFGSNVLLLRGPANVFAALREQLKALPADDAKRKEFVDLVMTNEGLATFLVVGAIVFCVIYMLGSTIGGALGVRAFNRPDDQA